MKQKLISTSIAVALAAMSQANAQTVGAGNVHIGAVNGALLAAGSGAVGDINMAAPDNIEHDNVYVGSAAGSSTTGSNNIAIGMSAGSAMNAPTDAVALGTNAGSGSYNKATVSIGAGSTLNANTSYSAYVGNNSGNGAVGPDNVGIGAGAGRNSTGGQNSAIGLNAGVNVKGSGNVANGYGAGSGIKADNTVAVGTNATASINNNVAIGANSADKAATQVGAAIIEGVTYSGFAGNASGVVSVGTKGSERQIVNVASGKLNATSTDAVNGSQLYAVAQATNSAIASLSTSTSTGLANTNSALSSLSTSTSKGLANTNSAVASLSTSVTNIYNTGTKYFKANSDGEQAQAIGQGSVAIGGGAVAYADNSVALGENSIANRANTVSVGTKGSERQIVNVASGVQDTDAVNVAQLKSVREEAVKEARSGTAAALAARVPMLNVPGKVTIGAAVGHWKGYTAGAAEVRYTGKSNKWLLGGGVTASFGKAGGAGVYVGGSMVIGENEGTYTYNNVTYESNMHKQ